MKIGMITKAGIHCEGGVATYIQNVCPILAKNGFDIAVYSTPRCSDKKNQYPYLNEILIPGNWTNLNDYVNHGFNQVQDAVNRDFDIIHMHTPSSALYLDKIKAKGKVAIVSHHGSQFIRYQTKDVKAKELFFEYVNTLKRADAITTHSPITKYDWKQYFDLDTVLVPHGSKISEPVPAKKIFELDKEIEPGNYFLFFGKFRPEKGADLLIEAYKIANADKQLVLAGPNTYDPDYGNVLRERCKKIYNIKFIGHPILNRMKEELISNAFCVVNPSKKKGLSLVVLEAMGYGVPVLSSDLSLHHGAIREANFHFKNNDARDLSEKLNYLSKNMIEAKEMAVRGKEYAIIHHSWINVAYQYEKIYNSIRNKLDEVLVK